MQDKPASQQIDDIIREQSDWKENTLTRLRTLIKQADPDVVEEVKWKTASRPEGLPVWSHNGIICIAETWKDNIKLVFFKGAQMKDANKLFNARLKSKTDRAVEFREDSTIDEAGIKKLVIEAMRLNS